MKPLAQLIKVEKARLLHQLFPFEMPSFIPYAKGVAEVILLDEVNKRAAWKENSPVSFDEWIGFAKDTIRKVDRYDSKLYRNARLFADQLFEGNHTFFMEYCLLLYTTTRHLKDAKFKQAVVLLFQ